MPKIPDILTSSPHSKLIQSNISSITKPANVSHTMNDPRTTKLRATINFKSCPVSMEMSSGSIFFSFSLILFSIVSSSSFSSISTEALFPTSLNLNNKKKMQRIAKNKSKNAGRPNFNKLDADSPSHAHEAPAIAVTVKPQN